MKRIIFLSLAGLLVAGIALAEDFWVKKEYMQWTDEEVKKIMSNSPWGKDLTISAPMAAIGGRGQRAAADSGNSTDVEATGGGGGGRGRRGGGGGGGGGGGAATEALITLNMSWRSALPLRKALVRSRLGAGAAVPADAQQLISKDEDDYVIVVTGVPAALSRTLQNPTLLEKSVIRAGKKPPVAARGMNIQPHTQSIDVIYAFPKTQVITADDKEVEVELSIGPLVAKKKFNLKDMVYNGKLEL